MNRIPHRCVRCTNPSLVVAVTPSTVANRPTSRFENYSSVIRRSTYNPWNSKVAPFTGASLYSVVSPREDLSRRYCILSQTRFSSGLLRYWVVPWFKISSDIGAVRSIVSLQWGLRVRFNWKYFRKVGIVSSSLLSMVTEGWIFYVSGLAIMSVGMMGHHMTGCHRRTRTAIR